MQGGETFDIFSWDSGLVFIYFHCQQARPASSFKPDICHFLISDGPSVVKLRLKNRDLSAGKAHQIKCEAIGAKPQATISWWVAGKQVSSLSYRKSLYPDQHHQALHSMLISDQQLRVLCPNWR